MSIPREYADRIRLLPSGCWQWTGAVVGLHNQTGALPYGVLIRDGQRLRAHRYFYETATGEAVGRRHLHHRCGNTLCVNPEHVEPLTHAEHNAIHGKFREQAEAARAATHCRHGHPWAENAYLWRGVRFCRACQADAQRRRREARRKPKVLKTHCPQGHPYEGDNLVIDSRGARNCRVCLREFSRERKRRFRERHQATPRTREGRARRLPSSSPHSPVTPRRGRGTAAENG